MVVLSIFIQQINLSSYRKALTHNMRPCLWRHTHRLPDTKWQRPRAFCHFQKPILNWTGVGGGCVSVCLSVRARVFVLVSVYVSMHWCSRVCETGGIKIKKWNTCVLCEEQTTDQTNEPWQLHTREASRYCSQAMNSNTLLINPPLDPSGSIPAVSCLQRRQRRDWLNKQHQKKEAGKWGHLQN